MSKPVVILSAITFYCPFSSKVQHELCRQRDLLSVTALRILLLWLFINKFRQLIFMGQHLYRAIFGQSQTCPSQPVKVIGASSLCQAKIKIARHFSFEYILAIRRNVNGPVPRHQLISGLVRNGSDLLHQLDICRKARKNLVLTFILPDHSCHA